MYALSVGFKTKPLRKSLFQCEDKNRPKICNKSCLKEQPFIFNVYLRIHIFQTSVLLIRAIESSQLAILVLNWIKHSFSLRVLLMEKFIFCAVVLAETYLLLLWMIFSDKRTIVGIRQLMKSVYHGSENISFLGAKIWYGTCYQIRKI